MRNNPLNHDDKGNIKLLYSVSELSNMVPLSKTEIYRYIKEGELPYVRFGKKKFFKPEDITDWIKRNEV